MQSQTLVFLAMTVCIGAVGCRNRGYNEASKAKSETAVSLYPPDPRVQVEDKSLNPIDRGSFKPSLVQKDALLRYALSLGTPELDKLSTSDEIQAALRAAAQAVRPEAGIAAANALADVGSSGSTIDRAKALQTSIQSAKHGIAPKEVCQAILVSDAVSGPAASADFLRVWLTACQGDVIGLPKTLDAFKSTYGDYASWPSELHPKSLVLHGGRRFYRSSDLKIRIAEALAADCSVKGTEGEMQRADGTWVYFAYNTEGNLDPESKFPGVGGRVIERLTPDSCLGCHGTFDTRRFNVPVPSYEALRLTAQLKTGKLVFQDATKCRKTGEPIWSAPEIDGSAAGTH